MCGISGKILRPQGDLRPLPYNALLGRRAADRRDSRTEVVRGSLDEHAREQAPCPYLLWNLLMLELWHRTFDGDGRSAQKCCDVPAAVTG